jgi:predicted nuclease of predicted toxin-antitoxin system
VSRFLADEQFPARVQNGLRRLGHDVEFIRNFDLNKSGDGKSDSEVLRIAMAENRIILTLNRKHFFALHNSGTFGGHRGIIACVRDDAYPRVQAKRIDALVRSVRHMTGQFCVIPRKLTRKESRTKIHRKHDDE